MLIRVSSSLLFCIVVFLTSFVEAQEWQQLPTDQRRLNPSTPNLQQEQSQRQAEIYKSGQGQIAGAFGIPFNRPLEKSTIVKSLGWVTLSKLPKRLSYTGAIKPFILRAFVVKPPLVPEIIQDKNISFIVYVDFENRPLWISAKSVPNVEEILEILQRKYGVPTEDTRRTVLFERGNRLEVERGGSRGVLNYYALEQFREYLDLRNLTLRKKYTELKEFQLIPKERQIMALASQMIALRQDMTHALGITFGQRVGFLVKPDEYTQYENPNPLKGFGNGVYRIMVNPSLIPIGVHFEISGIDAELIKKKALIDHSLEIAFGGFVKQNAKHTVLSFQGSSIAVLVRSGKLRFTFLNSDENKAYNERMKIAQRAKQEAQNLAKRLKEIEIEKGF